MREQAIEFYKIPVENRPTNSDLPSIGVGVY